MEKERITDRDRDRKGRKRKRQRKDRKLRGRRDRVVRERLEDEEMLKGKVKSE